MDTSTIFYVTVGLMIFSGIMGYYVGERGSSGVRIDLNNVKTELEKVKNLVTSKTIPQAVTIVTPSTGSQSTPATTTVVTPHI